MNKRNGHILIVLLLTCIIFSCDSHEPWGNITTGISPTDSLALVHVYQGMSSLMVADSLEWNLRRNICWKRTKFRLQFNDDTPFEASIFKLYEGSTIYCAINHPGVSIFMVKNGLVFLEYDLVTIDSIPNWIEHNFPSE